MTALSLINARVYTMDPGCPRATGLVIQAGRVSQLLSDNPTSQSTLPGWRHDLGGRTVLPGLIDSHLHLQNYAESLQKINCETPTKADCLERIRSAIQKVPPGQWILGHGWNHNIWPEGLGKAQDLDQITADHPVYLTGKSLHLSWANTLALDLAGISDSTPDPPGGLLGRDEQGYPTGILYEGAVKLVEEVIPKPGKEQIAASIHSAQAALHQLGITGVHDFDRVPCLEALRLLEKQGQLQLRVSKSLPAAYLPFALEQGLRTGQGSDWLWIGGIKDFMDGALGPQTAALLAPYQGTDQRGLLLKTASEIYHLGRMAAEGGLALSIHSIGDLANRTLLDAYTRLRAYEKLHDLPPLPHRIEHLQLIDPEDIPRLAELGITASMQPIHATSDMEMAEAYWGDRTRYAYAPRLQLEQGVRVIFGSDAPVEDPNPWLGIYAAVTRRRLNGSPGKDGWHPEGRISLQHALEAFTCAPADWAGRGKLQGRIRPGAWADLIVLGSDPFQIPADQLAGMETLGTMVNGNWVYKQFE